MDKIVWNLPNEEAIINRIEELEDCLQNFPQSKMAGIWRNAIDQLKSSAQKNKGAISMSGKPKEIPLEDKCSTLQLFFYRIKAYDIDVFIQNEHIIATDDDGNHWEDADIYDFALNECLGWDKNGNLMDGFAAVSNELAQKLKCHASAYGVTIKY